MKKLFASTALLAFLTIPAQGAFAWTYNGLGSLNPFTNFGRNNNCGCEKPKLTKCQKLHGMKIKRGNVCGCAAPVDYYYYIEEPVVAPKCNNCQRAF